MTTTQHTIIKPEKLAATAVGMLEDELKVPSLFQKESIDPYRGAKDDSISVAVEGVLPFHTYAWRNDRSNPLQMDTYAERKITVSFGGNYYSGVNLTDEQSEMDMTGWGKLFGAQTKAVARGLERGAVAQLETDATYEVVIGDAAADLRGTLIEARRVLNAFNAPGDTRYILCGNNYEAALLASDITLSQNAGDDVANAALRNASLGSLYGFNFIVDETINPDTAYAFTSSGFIFLNAAPSVPQSVPFGATASFEGVSLRWIRDYDTMFQQDRSVVNTFAGFQTVKDFLVGWDAANGTEIESTDQHFVRGVKLVLDGASRYPAANSDLGKITGVTGPGKQLKGAAATAADD